MSINSKGIFLTSNWRAKLTVFKAIPADESLKESGSLTSPGVWVAPEYVLYGSATEKVDIFAYGVVLLELISGKQAADGKLFEESVTFFGGGANEGCCFEQLRNFLDPCLKEDYPIAEALCLAVLASSCVEEDPLHRPSIDDVIKILARMIHHYILHVSEPISRYLIRKLTLINEHVKIWDRITRWSLLGFDTMLNLDTHR
ncbi:chitin elicitor receptor kinase 1-like [Olea europaea var. sylvestris]|uniref:chitin elicitor receptor kinase 1-like n=1 Tax=Olea europaea var. sylvestris TaxID=158386 RepID=UPI000C1D8925|nr:chitin elicitor receptor kinase 1-like [Olea europaea var. sylvestris]